MTTPPESGSRLSHVDSRGNARMVDVGTKPVIPRRAVAECFFRAERATIDAVMQGALPKGEALPVARIAGINAAKRCHDLIPLCHALPLDFAGVEFERSEQGAIRIIATAAATARTGVEMEALTAATVAALTLYDMTKAIDKQLQIDCVRLVSKVKGSADPVAGDPERPDCAE